jgi:RES domain-containing protein
MYCQCGTTFSNSFISDTYCNMACSGNGAEICGGGTNPIEPLCASVYSACNIFVKLMFYIINLAFVFF